MPRHRRYDSPAAKQAAYRARKHVQASPIAPLIALQATCAQQHLVERCGLSLQKHATAEQRHLQEEAKERDLLDALWMLQTLIADFGYDAVYASVLQHSTPRPPAPNSEA